MTAPRGIERRVLSEAFQDAMEGSRLRAAVFLTFRFDPGFFEQEILPVFFDIPLSHAPTARLLHLEQALRGTGSVAVYYDRRALESGAQSARTDFQRIGVVHRTGYFHPKNVLLLVESADEYDGARVTSLIVASLSANLTRAGWWQNVEVAHIDRVEAREQCSYRDDLLALVARIRRVSPADADHTALEEIDQFVRGLEQDTRRLSGGLLGARLLSGDRDLPEFLEDVAGGARLRGRCLEIISPYFDEQESTRPLAQLIERFRPRETRVLLPKTAEGEALCSEAYWESVASLGVGWGTLPADVMRLSRTSERFVHAKVYRFFDPGDRRETFFVGSVNLTNAGFSAGGNIESGFLIEQEGRRRNDWWMEADDRRPLAFAHSSESESLTVGPGVDLVLRFNWSKGDACAFWDASAHSPRLKIMGSGVPLGAIDPLEPRQPTRLDATMSERLKEHLVSSSFVTVVVDDAPDAVILVEEEEAMDKPSLLTTLSPADILRFWSLLTDAQKQEFFEIHADGLKDVERTIWGPVVKPPPEDGIFGTFAHVYLSFANLERAVRDAIDRDRKKSRSKEAVDRLFSRRFDSLQSLVRRIADKTDGDPVRDYVTLLCGLQLLDVLRREERDFYANERQRFELVKEIRSARDTVQGRFTFATEDERRDFFDWFERWFMRRAMPREVSA